jgi:hypothetical protein
MFSYYFCMMIDGSEFRAGSGSGSTPLTSESVSGKPKQTWIRWTQIRIQNTELISTNNIILSLISFCEVTVSKKSLSIAHNI